MAKNRPQSRSDVPWSKRWQIPDCQIVDAPDQYEEAFRLLLAQPPGSGVVLPLVNSAAVSIELYLKSLSAERIYTADAMMREGSVVTAYASIAGHSLKPLFEAIVDEVRAKLIEAYDAKLRFELKDDFVTALTRFDGAFSASRYPFEPNVNISGYNLQSLASIAKFLREFVRALPPKEMLEWR